MAGKCTRAPNQRRKAEGVEVGGQKVKGLFKTTPTSEFGPDFSCPFHSRLYKNKCYYTFILKERS